MDSETEKIIKEQIEKLPLEVRKLFTDPELGDKIINIGKKKELNTEQLSMLQTETYLVMLGLVHPDEYQNELKDRLKINDEKAITITKDINEQLFSNIKEKLKEAYEKTDNDLRNVPIKDLLKEEIKNANHEQNINFILSGGDYGAFVEVPPPLSGEDRGGVSNSPHPDPLLKGEGDNTSAPVLPVFFVKK